jgi:NAD dependent epimerase/dehydratase family enzyme
MGDSLPKLLLLGAGYTGQRFLKMAAEDARPHTSSSTGSRGNSTFSVITAWRSADWNLDVQAPLPVQGEWTHIAYLVPPPSTGETDPRLEYALSALLRGSTKLRRIVYLSTTGVYGDAGGGTVNEDTAPNPATPRARRRLAAETTLRSACAAAGVEWTVLRVPGIYGPGRLPLDRLRRGEPLPQAALARPGNRIHVDDLGQALRLALLHPAAANAVFNVGDGDDTGTANYLQQLAQLTGLPAPTVLPDELARPHLSAEAWSFLMEARRVDTRRLRERLGFEPRYPNCASGLQASLAEEAAAGCTARE